MSRLYTDPAHLCSYNLVTSTSNFTLSNDYYVTTIHITDDFSGDGVKFQAISKDEAWGVSCNRVDSSSCLYYLRSVCDHLVKKNLLLERLKHVLMSRIRLQNLQFTVPRVIQDIIDLLSKLTNAVHNVVEKITGLIDAVISAFKTEFNYIKC